MKDPKKPEFDSADAAPAIPAEAMLPPAGTAIPPAQFAEDQRKAQVAAIHQDRLEQANVHTRFDSTRYRRKEQLKSR